MPPRDDWARYVAPAAFLLAVTIAVLLIRSGLDHPRPRPAISPPAGTTTAGTTTTTASKPKPKPAAGRRFYTIQSGDTFQTVADRYGTTVPELERLNPGVKSTSLFIGEKIRVS